MNQTNEFLTSYTNLLSEEYPSFEQIFNTKESLIGWDLYSCLKDNHQKIVFIIRNQQTKEKRILKTVRQDSYETPSLEYTFLSNLSQDQTGFPAVYDYFEEGNFVFLIEEYIEGSTLQNLKDSGTNFSMGKIVHIGIELCNILSIMHSQNPPLIHRDITPSNIIYSPNGSLSLIDLGIARHYETHKTKDTVFVGTEVAAPPEQYGYTQTDARSDIYSLGILLYYLITDSYDTTLLGDYNIPKPLKKILLKCTQFSPAMRYESVEQLKSAFIKLQKDPFYEDQIENLQRDCQQLKRRNHVLSGLLFVCFLSILCFLIPSIYGNFTYYFYSPVIEEAVRIQLHREQGERISRKDLEDLTSLYLYGTTPLKDFQEYYYYPGDAYLGSTPLTYKKGVLADLRDLKAMKHLANLAICEQMITDLSPLEHLPLEHLYLTGNSISDLAPLASIKTLESLYLAENPFVDCSPLSSLTNLEVLNLDSNTILSLRFLESLDLTKLMIEGTSISEEDFAYVSQQTNLTTLRISYISENPIDILKPLSNLRELFLSETPITDLTFTENFPELDSLGCHNCRSLTSLSGSERLKNLNSLDLNACPITDTALLNDFPHLQFLTLQDIAIPENLLKELQHKNIQIEIRS